MVIAAPDETTRWRCRQCGNLTRFDVTRSSRVVEFVHVDLAGVAAVEDRQVLADVVERVRCRWCDAVDSVDLVARNDSGDGGDGGDPGDTAEPTGPDGVDGVVGGRP